LKTPLDELPFPVICASCGAGPFNDAIAVDEHITEEHLPEAVWAFAYDHMPPAPLYAHVELARLRAIERGITNVALDILKGPKITLTEAARIARGKLEPPKIPVRFGGKKKE
jgi:hypothetical protein